MRDLLIRLASGLVYILIFLASILFSEYSYIALTTFFAIVCIFEFSKITDDKSIIPFLLLPLAIYSIHFYAHEKLNWLLLGFTFIYLIKLIFLLFQKKEILFTTPLLKLNLSLRYIILPFSFLIALPKIGADYKPEIIICSLILIWVNDSFAYLVGKNFGRRKLFPSVSPKKTIEGFIGGLIFAVIASILIANYTTLFSTLNWVIIALILSTIGTIGDLIESKFKRQANIKDSGKIMPGHGGLLDRLDSLYFAAPFVYLYVHVFI